MLYPLLLVISAFSTEASLSLLEVPNTYRSPFDTRQPSHEEIEYNSRWAAPQYQVDMEPEENPSLIDDQEDSRPQSFLEVLHRERRGDVRLCGTQLTKTLTILCKNCIKPLDSTSVVVQEKRASNPFVMHKRSVTHACCEKKCSMDFLMTFCC